MLGYTSQAQFLINCGMGELLQKIGEEKVGDDETATDATGTQPSMDLRADLRADSRANLRTTGAVSVLLSPNEMGELFKVIALGRGMPQPLLGFTRGDRVHAL